MNHDPSPNHPHERHPGLGARLATLPASPPCARRVLPRVARVAARAGLALALAAPLVAPTSTHAGPPAKPSAPTPEQKEAAKLFDQGVTLSDEGKWSEALEAFRKSDELRPSLSARFNLAATMRALGRYVEAKRTLEKILTDGPTWDPPIKPALKTDVEKLLGEVKPNVVALKVKVTPSTAEVSVDGLPLERAGDGTSELDPGRHVFVVTAPEHETTTVTKTLAASDRELSLVAPKKQVVVVQKQESGGITTKWWFWTTAGVVVAGAAVAVVAVVVTQQPQATTGAPPATVGRIVPVGFRF